MACKGAVLLVVLKNQCGPSCHLPGFSTISWGGPSCTSLVICCGPSCHFPRFSTISWGEDLVQALWFCRSIFFTCAWVEVQFLSYKFGLKGLTYTRENTVIISLYQKQFYVWCAVFTVISGWLLYWRLLHWGSVQWIHYFYHKLTKEEFWSMFQNFLGRHDPGQTPIEYLCLWRSFKLMNIIMSRPVFGVIKVGVYGYKTLFVQFSVVALMPSRF